MTAVVPSVLSARNQLAVPVLFAEASWVIAFAVLAVIALVDLVIVAWRKHREDLAR